LKANNDNPLDNPNNMEEIIVNYIFNNPECEYRDLKKDLTIKDKKMTSKTLRYYLFSEVNSYNLIKKKHILASSERIYNGIAYPDNFIFNDEMLQNYPNLIQESIIKITSRLRDLKKERFSSSQQSYYLDFTFLQSLGFNISFKQKGQSRKFYFSDRKYNIFKTLLTVLIRECFIDNPELWHVFQNPKDLDFSLNLNMQYSKVPFFSDYFSFFKELSMHEKRIEGTEYSIKDLLKLVEEMKNEKIIKYDDLETFYAKAKFEQEKREREITFEKIQKLWHEYLKNPKKEYWNIKNEEDYLVKWFQFRIENQKRKVLDKDWSLERKLLNPKQKKVSKRVLARIKRKIKYEEKLAKRMD